MKYENRIIAFIDILGFKEKINASSVCSPSSIEGIASFLNDIRNSFQSGGGSNSYLGSQRVSCFSDCIVISFKAEERGILSFLLNGLIHLHMDAVRKGFLLRGGIAYGQTVHTSKMVFGPGMNAAHDLESKLAIYPRIILDEEIIALGKEFHGLQHGSRQEEKYLRSLIKKDADGFYYIDYFSISASEFDDDVSGWRAHLNDLSTIITVGLNSTQPGIKAKYRWMRTKYNAAVSGLKAIPRI